MTTTQDTPVSSLETITSVAFAMVVKSARDTAVKQFIAAGVEANLPQTDELVEQCLREAISLVRNQPTLAEEVSQLVSDKLRKLVFEGQHE